MELVMHLTDEQIDLIKELETSKEYMGYIEGTPKTLRQNNKDQHYETPCQIGNGRN